MIQVFGANAAGQEQLNRNYKFNFDSSDFLDVSTSGNMLDIVWEYSKVESGTNGNEFIITDARTSEDQDLLKVIIPRNNSIKSAKTCTITFTYQYEGNTDTSQIFSKNVVLTVDPAPFVDVSIWKDQDPSEIVLSDIEYEFNEGKTYSFILNCWANDPNKSLDPKSDGSILFKPSEINWEYSKEENGTSGNEFSVSNISDLNTNKIQVKIPTNTSFSNVKTCTITFTYQYSGNYDQSQVWVKRLVLIVKKANLLNFDIFEATDPKYTNPYEGSVYECNFGLLDGSINLDISTNGSGLPVVWKYNKIESGTSGNEFIIYNKSTSENLDRLNIIIPSNQYSSKLKTCDIVFTYYFEGVTEESQYKSKTIQIAVKSPEEPKLNLYKIIDDTSVLFVDSSFNCDFGVIDGSIIVDVDNSTGNLIPVLYEYSTSESGTSGNEFIISNISDALHPNRLKIFIPYNLSNIKSKSCNLILKYHYSGNDLQSEAKTKIIKLIVGIAPKPSVSLDPNSKQWPGNHETSYIDISVNIENSTAFPVSWDYTTVESGTSGIEFPIVKGTDKFSLTVPKNESLEVNKTCYVTVTCYYSEATEHINDNYTTGTYVVTVMKGPVISFDKESTLDNPITYKLLECSEDSSTYDISIYAIIDLSLTHPNVERAKLNKTSLTYNSIEFGTIKSDEILFDEESRLGLIELSLLDNIFEENISDYVLITAYDKYGHQGTVLRLEIKQNGLINYCPDVKTSKVSASATTSDKFYNLGFAHYGLDKELDSSDNVIEKKENGNSEYYEVLDFGLRIKMHDNANWTTIWNSKYHDDLISSKEFEGKKYLYSVSLPYTNNVFKYTSGKLYDYTAVAKVNYRKGKKEKEEWVLNEIVEGDIKQFKLGDLWESNLEYIRPYFKPVEKVNGYLSGVEIKNFINSKGIVFNRKKCKTIDITNWYNNYSFNGNSLSLNINDAIIDLVIHSESFNKAWNYIKDPINIVNAKRLYIQKNILPNILINEKSKLDVYYDKNSTSKGLLDSYNTDLIKLENLSHKLTFSTTNNSYTMNLTLPENKQYCVVLHLQY